MSKKKFGLLLGFMVFSFLSLIIVVGFEVNNYFNPRENKSIGNVEDMENDTDPIDPDSLASAREEEENLGIDEDTTEELTQSELSLLFAGDVLLSDYLLNLYDKDDSKLSGIISKELLDIMTSSDVLMVNQEFPFSSRGARADDKQFTFRVHPNRVDILSEMGIDIVTLANNHTLDYGQDALLDTIDTLDHVSIRHVGAGRNLKEAKELVSTRYLDKNIAFLGASRVIPVYEWNAFTDTPGLFTTYDPALLLEEIKKAKLTHDIVVVYVHWGEERSEFPKDYQRKMGKQYIDAGADLVIGAHPHVLQGIEYYKGKPIIYSLGNFIFGSGSFQTMLLKAQIAQDGYVSISLIPCQTEAGFTSLKDKKQWKEFYKYMEQISPNITIDEYGAVSEKE